MQPGIIMKYVQTTDLTFGIAFLFPDLSRAQRTLSKSLTEFNFECIGSTITDDEMLIVASLRNFGNLIAEIETERDKMVRQLLGRLPLKGRLLIK